ncbi:hypothetical protein ACTWP5_13815 [Streptomyces sp. 4N509B]|uniref:hypothetical protein n=1 Tax=Streptomyces sp. 4N509B TaxID=3457413 RepID=UPI003FD4A2BA
MMTTAGAWYTSGTLWTAVSAIAALVAIPVAAWVAIRVGNPKRLLSYDMSATALLRLGPSNAVRSTLEVRRNGAILTEPHVLEIELRNDGRRDIPSAAFDGGQPLRLDVGVPIVELLETSSAPHGYRVPPITVSGSALEVGPGMISRGQRLTLSVLADGRNPSLTLDVALLDVRIRRRESGEDWKRVVLWATTAVVAALVSLVGSSVETILFHRSR